VTHARRLQLELAALLVVLVAVAILFSDARRLFWTHDDAFLLRVTDSTAAQDYFASPAFWRAMPAAMFVPGVMIWYETGARTGAAEHFHALAIALLLLALIASYCAMRVWLDIVPALTATVLIALGAPAIAVVLELMAGHYLLALLFSALAILTFRRSPIASALFYLLAMLAKEIAIPLPLLLLLLPVRDPRTRVRRLVPHAMAGLLYFAWRRVMIGRFLGGYGWAVTRENLADLLLSLPKALAQAITPSSLALAILVGLVILVPIAWQLRSRRVAIAFVVALVIAIGPIVPVARELQPRYAFATWIVLAVFFAIAVQTFPARVRTALCIIAIAIVAIGQRMQWRESYPLLQRMSAEARFAVDGPPDATLRLPATPPAAMGELQWIRTHNGAAPGLQWFYDDIQLCSDRHQHRRLFEYDQQQRAVVDVTSRQPELARKHCGAIREDAPLETHFRFARGTLHWDFGPYTDGSWHVLFADGIQAFAVPRRDAFILGEIPGISLRVRYDSPQGWVTYSPELTIDFAKQLTFDWKR
jgi:hypothetical protein